MAVLASGSYRGSAEGLTFEFRVGRASDGRLDMISGDATRDGAFLASFFGSAVNEDASSGAIWGAVRFRGHPELFTGEVRLEADERGVGSFYLGVDLEGNYRDVFAGRLQRMGSFMRRLVIEIDGLDGTEPPASSGYAGRTGAVTIARAFESAGFDTMLRVDAFRSRAPRPQEARGYTLAEIHSAMEAVKLREAPDGLHVHVFVCSYLAGRDGRGVLGVMYDFDQSDLNRRPREGVAVFYDHPLLSDPRVPETDRQREYVFTVVHEVGHALNLLHSFDKARPSALSWMNYPHLYPRGYEAGSNYDGTSEFWRRFPEIFDEEELLHLHHASPREIAAGGFAFGTYEDGASRPFGGAAEPRLTRPGGNPLRAIGGIELQVSPLKREYAFGEPVFLKIAIANVSDHAVHIPDALDPTDGYLRITLRSPSGRIIPYRPPVKLCRQAQLLRLPPGALHEGFDGAPIFLSSAGPVFTEPGDYQVTAELTGVDFARVIYARPTVIRIRVPDRSSEKFAERLWDHPAAMKALYLRHPLVDRDAWNAVKEGPIPEGGGNTTSSYLEYIAALGWLTPFAAGHGRREQAPDPEKAAEHLAKVDPSGLPGAVGRRKAAVRADRAEGAPGPARTFSMARRAPERLRADVPPAGLFGALGLGRAGPQADRGPLSPFERIVTKLRGTRRFADLVSWNIEHLHDPGNWKRIPRIAELIRSFRCDFWGLQEVDQESLRELTDIINSTGRTRYAYHAAPGKGQQSGVLYRSDTTRVAVIEPRSDELNEAFSSEMDVRLANGKKAKRRIFHRRPLFLDVRITQGSVQVFDFRCAVVHLKSTDAKLADTGSSLRAAAARLLARWIADDRGQGIETDYLILGDMNAETAEQGLRDFSEQNGLDLLSVGMRETYGQDDALTRVASKRLLDHIVVTSDSVALMPEKDLGEQIIIRSDAVLSDWTREFSDHVPVAVRFVLRSDVD